MARAKRHYIPGQIWHITHRCHKREFLLKLIKDRRKWLQWLFEAKRRYGLIILNYTVTSNHIHLLVFDEKGRDVIPDSLKLVAGRTGQEYNLRKKRKGAFWEDRYHATAVESEQHLFRCLAYIDLNMVRAGAVPHPAAWRWSGYCEIQYPDLRYTVINQQALVWLFGVSDFAAFQSLHKVWIEEGLNAEKYQREPEWSQCIAIGSKDYLEDIKLTLGLYDQNNGVIQGEAKDTYVLKESAAAYQALFVPEKCALRGINTVFIEERPG